jgi:hypothetical protein
MYLLRAGKNQSKCNENGKCASSINLKLLAFSIVTLLAILYGSSLFFGGDSETYLIPNVKVKTKLPIQEINAKLNGVKASFKHFGKIKFLIKMIKCSNAQLLIFTIKWNKIELDV